MRIVIDMQGAQTESRFRGIGRYTLAFAQAVVRNRGEHEVVLALSGLFPDAIEPIRAAFDGLLPQENIRLWSAPGPVSAEHSGNDDRRETAKLIREAFLASLQPDVIHITSLFEGYADDAVTSIGEFDADTPVSVTLYDLIPLLNPGQYLTPNPRYASSYERKIAFLRRATLMLAISEHARQEGVDALEGSSGPITNVGTAIGDEFHPVDVTPERSESLLNRIGATRAVVLYTGGADERKNLSRLIEAWANLPVSLRQTHQLLFAGRMPQSSVVELRQIAHRHGLLDDELLFSGYVSDEELVQLYNLCKLYVFPSWHEGFGLPVLEAMACGAPVIGANTTSLPEVIGLEAALFDPFKVTSIRDKIQAALTDEAFLGALRTHGLAQSKRFSWDATAQRAIAAWEGVVASTARGKIALPCIGDHMHKNLLNAITRHLGVVEDQALVALAAHLAQNENAGIERQLLVDISELCQRDAATGVQRVVRSYLHHLLRDPPRGFRVQPVYATQTDGYRYAQAYIAKMLDQSRPIDKDAPIRWKRGDLFFGLDMQHHVQLAHAGTYAQMRREGVIVKFLVYDLLPIQLADFFKDNNAKALHEQWLTMIASQDEAICISKATADAYEDWISRNEIKAATRFSTDWVHMGADLEGSNPSVGLPQDAAGILEILSSRPTFLTVSTLEPRKAQGQILDAVEELWARGTDVNLVFVGQQGWKIDALVDRIAIHPENGKRLFWLKGISDEYLGHVYQASACLVAASINEGYGLPLIEAARYGTPVIARDIPVFREVAAESAFYFNGETGEQLASALLEWLELHRSGSAPLSIDMRWSTWQQSTESLKAALIERHYPRHQLLVDISELAQRDARTGIQRVVRSILSEWVKHPPQGFSVEPVYATIDQPYRYARKFTARFMGDSEVEISDEPIDYQAGDVFLGLDLNHIVPKVHENYLRGLDLAGVNVQFLVYDLLPIQFPEFWGHTNPVHLVVADWMKLVASFGGVVCISENVAHEFSSWMKRNNVERKREINIRWFHLGADHENSVPSQGLPENADSFLLAIKKCTSFLMVGTLEPRKGHQQVLDAFEILWKTESNISLVIVGKQGWMVEDLVDRIRTHKELGKRLFWLDSISDEYLEQIYASSSCLIAASYGEGFGLPLIEAAQHKLPVMARDIPVFREVAGEHAFYFASEKSEEMAVSLGIWLALFNNGQHPRSDLMPWLTWKESSLQLARIISGDYKNLEIAHTYSIMSDA
ncbi:glycosyltransferase family 4 protein [Ottowia thiooxydans]|uniref:glycosyltransferase family 4 protein n=1 Tax=Ottowia thiooxydans TaxID=219182 RepID=UPI00041DAEEE|nr:glycosyltransferase family 1 protein [Ottowia thiooxydans]